MKLYPFSEVFTDATAKFTKIKASDYHGQGRYKIIDQGKELIAGYTDDASLVNGQLLPIVIFGDHTRALKYVDEPIALGADGAKALWVNPDLANARYVYYYLRSIQIKEAGYSRHFKFLKEIAIPIPYKEGAPDFDEQIRIAHLLGKVEGLIAQSKQHLQQLDDLLKSVFLEMFGFRDQTYTKWAIDALEVYTKIVSGVTKGKKYNSEDLIEVPYMRVANVQDGHFVLDEIKTIFVTQKEVDQYLLLSGDLLLTEGGDPDKLGRGSVWKNQIENCIHQNHIFRVRINEHLKLNPYYLSALIGSRYGKSYFLKSAKQTTGIASINSTQLKNFPVVIPPIDLQNQFAAIVEKVENLKSRYQQSLIDLESLYSTLSQQAFKGELDLSRVPLPGTQPEEENTVAVEPLHSPPAEGLVINLPDIDNLLDTLENAEARATLISQWLGAYRGQLGNMPFSVQHIMAAVQTRLAELYPDNDFALGASDYEHIKVWVFEALAAGKLVQTFDDTNNRIHLKAVQP